MNNKTTVCASLSLYIDSKKRAIVMTKKFEKASRYVGSTEYEMLQKARVDYPSYRVETRATKKNPNIKNLLNYKFMERYIQKHDESKLEDFQLKTTKIKDLGSERYVDVRDWFLKEFPEITSYKSLREAMLAA